MPGGSLGNGEAEGIPQRMLVYKGRIVVRLAEFEGGVYQQVDDPMTLYENAFELGPANDIRITDPVIKAKQTAIGDAGECMRPIRQGEWKVEVGAMIDLYGMSSVSAVLNFDFLVGDFRFGSLQHQIVNILILQSEQARGICFGVGIFEAGLSMPLREGGTALRDVTISRRFGQKYGGLRWANMSTGTFV